MLEKIKYQNHKGEYFESIKDGIYANYNTLRDYKWGYSTVSDRISKFYRGVAEKTIPLIILCDSEETGVEIKNKIFSITERDILNKTPGNITINDYQMQGYVVGCKKTKYLITHKYLELELIFVTDSNTWVKTTQFQFRPQIAIPSEPEENIPDISGEITQGKPTENNSVVRDFPFDFLKPSNLKITYPLFDFKFDLVGTYGRRTLKNESFVGANFVMIIYGFVDNPNIQIAGHPYSVYATVYEGERLIIDSAAGTVKKIGRLGEETNLYNARRKDYSVFQKIPPGVQTVSWSGTYGIDIVLFDERSEPKWSL